ncbi:MAG: ATP-dependent DNA helicase RecG [Candidatus Krumholzibacteriota bacterium]|nr:ATP-dependent DNA helicase RecG [Candidatus Krumholzibacteriota bacterium]
MEKGKKNSNPLHDSSQYVKGVGPSRQVLLSKLGISTVEDLILHFPRNYYDRSTLVTISQIDPHRLTSFWGTVLAVSKRNLGPRRSILTVALGDESGITHLIFFNQPYLEKQFKPGLKVIASGVRRTYRGQKQVVAPEFEILSGELGEELIHTGRIVPIYPLTAGISQRTMRRIVHAALEKAACHIIENLPPRLIESMDFPSRPEAFREIHYPSSARQCERAINRFKFEEVFFLHLLIHRRRNALSGFRPRPPIPPPHPLTARFINTLPFELTGGQKRVLGDIRRDMESEKGVSRLLQGDVGSGKTIVCLVAMMMAMEKGFQAALMVPTEILAVQHLEKIRSYLRNFSFRVELLIGSMKIARKKEVQGALGNGEVDLIVGTHALIQEGIAFKQLGMAVIDEQHRFGVKQRASLGQGNLLPHFLVMTATPIPRSLAQTVYGDLDLSVIDELPFGKRKVKTEIAGREDHRRVYAEVKEAFRRGNQAFILYPLVEESEKSDLKAATEEFERLQRDQLRGFPLGLLHGRMSFEEKSKAIEMFRSRKILGLVTTTVIEVGVDIPNASVLLVNHPERFGLAQLHQLRGRVGRGGGEGSCHLLTDENLSGASEKRLAFFASHDDGFKVAEADLKLRGPGEIWGYRQSGYPAFKLLNPLSDSSLVQRSWEESRIILEGDPELRKEENKVVSNYFHLYYKAKMELAEIG